MPRRPVSSVSRRLLALLLALAGASCAAPRPPSLDHAVETSWGVVRAARRDDAVEIALVVERIAPQVAAAIDGRRESALDIRLVEALPNQRWGGATITTEEARWIELLADRRDAAARAILAHELVHFWLGPAWAELPPAIEEGLAIHLAHKAVPEAAPRERGELALVLGTLLEGGVSFEGPGVARGPAGPILTSSRVRYTMRARIDAQALPPLASILALDTNEIARLRAPGARAVLDALAYVAVGRIGVGRLRQLCEQARVLGHARIPAEWIWTSARLDPRETVSLEREVRAMLGTAEIRALLLRGDLKLGAPLDVAR
ncbi:MAG: hypothetical protein JNK02_17690 [Planctomycetes bacterium]|nr:hypothetical protein [Planctomycetota bacterium]